MNNDDISIEKRLKDFRKKFNLSQEQLAGELGISRQSVISLEQGKCLPSLPIAISLCRVFKSTFEEFFEIEQELNEEVDNFFNESPIEIKVINSPKPNLALQEEAKDGKENMLNEMEPWRPFKEVSLRDAMDRLLEDSFITPKSVGAVMPKIDIRETKDDVIVKAELPGVKEEEVDIEISDGVMTISGEKKEAKEKEEEGYYYRESRSGAFSRSFALPADVKADEAEAEMKNGVLTITLPKVAPKEATKVKIAAKNK